MSRATSDQDEPSTVQIDDCAICWEESLVRANLPCCNIPITSSTQYCQRCIEVICEQGHMGVGRCPNCRKWIRKEDDAGTFTVSDRVEPCAVCHKARIIVATHRGHPFCDACLMGSRRPLRYECESCHRYQRIPHPMYRYQNTPVEYGNDTWACQSCGKNNNPSFSSSFRLPEAHCERMH